MNPYISVITPTKDRPEFLPNILRNFFRQDYSLDRMELIIGDDSEKSFKNILPEKDNIRYFHLECMPLGKKRNFLCDKAKGDIIIFMDDDDYYPSDKVSYTVNNLWQSKYLVSGSSIMYVYYICYDTIFKFGPYRVNNITKTTNHSTCGTLAFKKEYFQNHKFPENATRSEEKYFLNDWNTKVLQLNPFKSILCIAHLDNTVDKHKYIKSGIKTSFNLKDFDMKKIDIDFYKSLLKIQGDGNYDIINI